MTGNKTVEEIAKINPSALVCEGFDEAIIGWGAQHGSEPVIIYDYLACLKVLMRDNDWDMDEAGEWMEYNVVNSYAGKGTPIFMLRGEE
tara:strand:+ start:558 stop:824 length:267 start_codon:yes stop_codon:yes gene_type:complete